MYNKNILSLHTQNGDSFDEHCGMEQLVARWAHNPKVVCSSQAPATK